MPGTRKICGVGGESDAQLMCQLFHTEKSGAMHLYRVGEDNGMSMECSPGTTACPPLLMYRAHLGIPILNNISGLPLDT